MPTTDRRSFTLLVAALWLANILPALDATLVGTALPTVIGSLDGVRLYSWVFATYLLALTVSIPVFGKLTDLFGRKPVYFVGMGLFIVGSTLSSLVQNVEQLIACRILLGLATASVVPAAMTIMGDAIPMERRAKIQWVFASAWFVSSVIGPAVASLVIAWIGWRAVFLVLVPPGLLATYLMATCYHEHVERRSRRVDILGVALLGGGVLALLFALSPTNRSGGIDLASAGGLLTVAAVLLALFVRHELRTAEAVLPPRLFLAPVLGIAALGSVASGVVQSGAQSFVPMFVQGGMGGTAADVGLVLPWLTIGWPIGAGLAGRFLLRVGFRRSVLAGLVLVVTAQGGFLLANAESGRAYLAAVMALLGLGFGFSSVPFTIAVQSSVAWGDRGVATSSLQFFRSIGGSVGVAAMGTIVSMRMQPLLAAAAETAPVSTSALLDPAARTTLQPEILAMLQQGMVQAIHDSFWLMAVAAIAGLVAVLWFPATVHEPTPAIADPAARR